MIATTWLSRNPEQTQEDLGNAQLMEPCLQANATTSLPKKDKENLQIRTFHTNISLTTIEALLQQLDSHRKRNARLAILMVFHVWFLTSTVTTHGAQTVNLSLTEKHITKRLSSHPVIRLLSELTKRAFLNSSTEMKLTESLSGPITLMAPMLGPLSIVATLMRRNLLKRPLSRELRASPLTLTDIRRCLRTTNTILSQLVAGQETCTPLYPRSIEETSQNLAWNQTPTCLPTTTLMPSMPPRITPLGFQTALKLVGSQLPKPETCLTQVVLNQTCSPSQTLKLMFSTLKSNTLGFLTVLRLDGDQNQI